MAKDVLESASNIVTGISEKEFRAELRYRMSLAAARRMLKEGLISKKEYSEIDMFLLKRHGPLLGTLLAGKPM